MKTFFLITMMALLSCIGLSAQKAEKGTGLTEIYLGVNMDCHSCESKLSEHLKFERGIKDLACSFESGTVYVKFKTGSNSQEKIVKSIEKLDYKVDVLTKEQYLEKARDAQEHKKPH
ncbi:MAG: heavy-metal-associated domain-containing protein [Breznakibacter sp.]